MSGYIEHRKKGLWALTFMALALVLYAMYGGNTFMNQDVFGFYHLGDLPIPLLIIGFLLGVYASLLPDIDIGTSKVYHWTVVSLLFLVIAFVGFSIYYWETIAILVFLLSLHFLNHRGLTHEWWFGGLVAIAFALIFGQSITVGILVLTGYYTHLWLDG